MNLIDYFLSIFAAFLALSTISNTWSDFFRNYIFSQYSESSPSENLFASHTSSNQNFATSTFTKNESEASITSKDQICDLIHSRHIGDITSSHTTPYFRTSTVTALPGLQSCESELVAEFRTGQRSGVCSERAASYSIDTGIHDPTASQDWQIGPSTQFQPSRSGDLRPVQSGSYASHSGQQSQRSTDSANLDLKSNDCLDSNSEYGNQVSRLLDKIQTIHNHEPSPMTKIQNIYSLDADVTFGLDPQILISVKASEFDLPEQCSCALFDSNLEIVHSASENDPVMYRRESNVLHLNPSSPLQAGSYFLLIVSDSQDSKIPLSQEYEDAKPVETEMRNNRWAGTVLINVPDTQGCVPSSLIYGQPISCFDSKGSECSSPVYLCDPMCTEKLYEFNNDENIMPHIETKLLRVVIRDFSGALWRSDIREPMEVPFWASVTLKGITGGIDSHNLNFSLTESSTNIHLLMDDVYFDAADYIRISDSRITFEYPITQKNATLLSKIALNRPLDLTIKVSLRDSTASESSYLSGLKRIFFAFSRLYKFQTSISHLRNGIQRKRLLFNEQKCNGEGGTSSIKDSFDKTIVLKYRLKPNIPGDLVKIEKDSVLKVSSGNNSEGFNVLFHSNEHNKLNIVGILKFPELVPIWFGDSVEICSNDEYSSVPLLQIFKDFSSTLKPENNKSVLDLLNCNDNENLRFIVAIPNNVDGSPFLISLGLSDSFELNVVNGSTIEAKPQNDLDLQNSFDWPSIQKQIDQGIGEAITSNKPHLVPIESLNYICSSSTLCFALRKGFEYYFEDLMNYGGNLEFELLMQDDTDTDRAFTGFFQAYRIKSESSLRLIQLYLNTVDGLESLNLPQKFRPRIGTLFGPVIEIYPRDLLSTCKEDCAMEQLISE